MNKQISFCTHIDVTFILDSRMRDADGGGIIEREFCRDKGFSVNTLIAKLCCICTTQGRDEGCACVQSDRGEEARRSWPQVYSAIPLQLILDSERRRGRWMARLNGEWNEMESARFEVEGLGVDIGHLSSALHPPLSAPHPPSHVLSRTGSSLW